MVQWHMDSLGERPYVPVLAGRRGDLEGLAWLSDVGRTQLRPLVQVLPSALDSVAAELAESWGGTTPILLDTVAIDPRASLRGRHHLLALLDSCRGRVHAVPVGGLGRGIDHMAAIAGIAALQRHGAAIRAALAELADGPETERRVDAWLAVVDLVPEQVDMVVDLGELGRRSHDALAVTRAVLRELPYAARWRSLTVVGRAFPPLPPGRGANRDEIEARADFRLWSELEREELPRAPGFGDHAIGRREPPFGVTLTYTAGCSRLVFTRRLAVRQIEQLRAACQALVHHTEYAGAGHCRGCAAIAEWAAGGSPEHPQEWRAAVVCHHIETIAAKLARPPQRSDDLRAASSEPPPGAHPFVDLGHHSLPATPGRTDVYHDVQHVRERDERG